MSEKNTNIELLLKYTPESQTEKVHKTLIGYPAHSVLVTLRVSKILEMLAEKDQSHASELERVREESGRLKQCGCNSSPSIATVRVCMGCHGIIKNTNQLTQEDK